jgi:hypothetical protein
MKTKGSVMFAIFALFAIFAWFFVFKNRFKNSFKNSFKKSDGLVAATGKAVRKLSEDAASLARALEARASADQAVTDAQQARLRDAETIAAGLAAAVRADKELIAAEEIKAVEEITELDDELDDTTKALKSAFQARVAELRAALTADLEQAQNERDQKADVIADRLEAFVASHEFQEDVANAVLAQAIEVIVENDYEKESGE